MKLLAPAAVLCLGLACSGAQAREAMENDAIAMTERSAALVKARGKAETIRRINARDPAFVQGAFYVGMRDIRTGVMLAHSHNPESIGMDLTDVPDANGKKYRRAIIDLAAARGKGWVDYTYRNPASGRFEPRTAYVMKVGDIVLEAGIHKK